MVTAEAAMVIPFLLVLSLTLGWLVTLGVAESRCVDGAREGARVLARGDSRFDAEAAARRAAPPGADVTIVESDGLVTVRVTAQAHSSLSLLASLPAIDLHASAVSASETSDGP